MSAKQTQKPTASARTSQVGGDHYTKLAIQPMDYSEDNGLSASQHTAIKYITRFKDKHGKKDLLKARHMIDWMIEKYYPEEMNISGDPLADHPNPYGPALEPEEEA